MLDIRNHAKGELLPNRASATLNSLLRAIKVWYIVPALFKEPNGRIKRRQRFMLTESGEYSPRAPVSDGVNEERGFEAAGCRPRRFGEMSSRTGAVSVSHSGGVRTAARTVLEDSCSGGNEGTWAMMEVKLPSEDHIAVAGGRG